MNNLLKKGSIVSFSSELTNSTLNEFVSIYIQIKCMHRKMNFMNNCMSCYSAGPYNSLQSDHSSSYNDMFVVIDDPYEDTYEEYQGYIFKAFNLRTRANYIIAIEKNLLSRIE